MIVKTCSQRPLLLDCGLEKFNYQIDPYVGCQHNCHYCYVLENAETDWKNEILIYRNIREQLEEELEGVEPQTIYMGYHSDPYQQAEKELNQTGSILEIFLKKGFSASILTKSFLVLRDVRILSQMENAAVSFSAVFDNNRTRELFEYDTIDTEKRIKALSILKERGVKTGALVCPVFPFVTDPVKIVEKISPVVYEIWIYRYSAEDRNVKSWKNVEKILRKNVNETFEKMEEIIFSKNHEYWDEKRSELLDLKEKSEIKMNVNI